MIVAGYSIFYHETIIFTRRAFGPWEAAFRPNSTCIHVAIIGGSMATFGQRDARIRGSLVEAGEVCPRDDGSLPPVADQIYVPETA